MPTHRNLPAAVVAETYQRYGRDCWLGLPGCTHHATQCDHVLPWSDGGSDTVANLRPVCQHCNALRGDRVLSGYPAQIHVVCGPPEAGKSTYVNQHRRKGDLVLDYDQIAAALCPDTDPRIKRTKTLTDVTRAAWKGAFSRLVRSAEPTTIWIIKAIPASQHHPYILDEWIALNYQVTVVDPGAAVVFDRIAADHRPSGVRVAAQRWYSLHITQAIVDSRLTARRAQLAKYGLGLPAVRLSRPRW